MITKNVEKYCKDFTLIKNYAQAVLDSKMWVIHHIKEIEENMSIDELIEKNLYYNRPPEELVFLPRAEYAKLRFSKKQTELHKQKRAEKLKGRKLSESTKKKMSEAHLRKRFWAKLNKHGLPLNIVFDKHCPDGYVEYKLNPYGYLGLDTDEDLFIRAKDDVLFYASDIGSRKFSKKEETPEENLPSLEESRLMKEFVSYMQNS